ncbi:hypothetical protein AB0D97_04305 [Streptomyces roseus]|uniref:hypothetical protein n=1 Tax=Streptomyces roseus TaxID=66430 RepID=UPI0033D50FDE
MDIPPDDDPAYRPISLGEHARLDRCSAGFALHIGGPEVKTAAAMALTGPARDLATATDPVTGMYPLEQARIRDRDAAGGAKAANERRQRWEASNYVYWDTGSRGGVSRDAPQFDKDIVAFAGLERELSYKLGSDGHAVATEEAVKRATALATELKGKDLNNDFVTDSLPANASNRPAAAVFTQATKSAKNEDGARDFKNHEAKLKAGNDQAGIGGAALSGGVRYQRAKNGGRVFYRKVGETFEIVAMCDKKHEDKVIAELKRLYG